MPFAADIVGRLAGNNTRDLPYLEPISVAEIERCLSADVGEWAYRSSLSMAVAASLVHRDAFRFAHVSLYYSVFFGIRAQLNALGVVWTHVGTRMVAFDITANTWVKIDRGKSSHEQVAMLFKRFRPKSILFDIEFDELAGLDWLRRRRETANYRIAENVDPVPSPWLGHLSNGKLRGAVSSYVRDECDPYHSDEDHAAFALPFAFLNETGLIVHNYSDTIKARCSAKHLKKLWADSKGVLPGLDWLLFATL